MSNWKLGTHVDPDAVVAAPDYAKRLVEEAGVDHFILRTTYGLDIPESTGEAVQIIRDVKAGVHFLAGSFWGGSTKIIENLPSKSWESRFPMEMPGSPYDAKIIHKLETLCRDYKPDGIVDTHGRFRHPGYIDGVFDEGTRDPEYLGRMAAAGIPREDMLAARAAWEKALGKMDKASLLKRSERGMIPFLCELSESDALERLVAFRCRIVHASLREFRKAVKAFPGVTFGSNAYSHIAARLCGQTYDVAYTETCEFVQPLLLYMEYHRYEPIAAFARYIMQFTGVDDSTAIEVSKNLFDLCGTLSPNSVEELDTCHEGDDRYIRSIVGRELERCAPYVSQPYELQPVLRGRQWGRAVTDELIEKARGLGINEFTFMGCDYLVPGEPSPGWF